MGGPVSVGDTVLYELSRVAPGTLELNSVNNEALTYASDIKYKVSAVDVLGGSELSVELVFHAKNRFYLRVWQRIEAPLVEMIAAGLKIQAKRLVDARLGPTAFVQ